MKLEKVVEILIEAGRNPALELPECGPLLERVRRQDYINRLGWQTWDDVTDALAIPDCVALTKALVVCEERFRWIGGSVAAVIWVYRAIERRDSAVARELVDWIVPRSTNDWAPFGSLLSRTSGATSYQESCRWAAERRATRAREIAAEEAAAKERRAERFAEGERIRAQQAKAAEARREWLAEYLAKPMIAQLRELATSNHLHVNYFPDTFERVQPSVLRALESSELSALLARIVDRREARWRRLKAVADEVSGASDGGE